MRLLCRLGSGINQSLIGLLSTLYLIGSFIALFVLPISELLAISEELGLKPLLLFDLLPLFIAFLPLLLFDLILQHPLQVLLLVLLPLIYVLGYLLKPVHRPRYRRPRVLERLLELCKVQAAPTIVALSEDRHRRLLLLLHHHHEVPPRRLIKLLTMMMIHVK